MTVYATVTRKASVKGKKTTTVRKIKTKTTSKARLVGRSGAEPDAEAVEAATSPAHALFARNLCPYCPEGAAVGTRRLLDRFFKRDVAYCWFLAWDSLGLVSDHGIVPL